MSALRLARLRQGLALAQYVVAKRARLAASRLSVLERGYDEPTRCERANLAAVLGEPEERLFPAASPTPAAVSPLEDLL